jgi:hypothetical protein
MDDRVRVLEGDAAAVLEQAPELVGQVDLIATMFVLHEFCKPDIWGALPFLASVRRMLRPVTGRFIVLDKCTDSLGHARGPLFFTEFKLIHDLTDQNLLLRRDWSALVEKAGLRISHEEMMAPHTGNVLLECRTAD